MRPSNYQCPSRRGGFFLLLAGLLWLPLQSADAALTENGSRIADSSRTALVAIDVNYTLTSNSQLIVYAAGVYDATDCRLRDGEGGHSPQYRVLAGSWANVPTSNGSGPYLEASGTSLTNNSSVSSGERLANTGGSYVSAGKEFTSSTNLDYSGETGQGQSTEAQWAMNFSNSPDNTTYEFRMRWGTKDCGTQYITYSAQITTASSGPHFSISHDGNADVSVVENITIAHHDGSHSVDTSYTGTITLSTSTSNGDWSLVTGSGTLNNSGNGDATYTYVGADNASVVLGLVNTNAEILNIDITDGTYSEDASEDADLSTIGPQWGQPAQNPTSTTANHSRSMGGVSPDTDDMQITEIGIYLGAQTGDVRLAVYTGGSLDNPSAATLLWDAGTVNPSGVAGWYTISGAVSWPKNTVTWLAWKRNNGVAVYYSTSSADAGDFQTVRGRDDNSFSQDASVAYPATYGDTGSFTNYWYSIYVAHTTVASGAPTPDPMTFAVAPDDASTTSIDMTATTASDPDTPIEYLLTYTACSSDGGAGGTSSSWQTSTYYLDTGLQVNQCYGYTVTARDSIPNVGTASAAAEAYTAANVPGTPTLGSATATTLALTNAENSNPASNPTTLFAVQVVTTSPNDATWLNKWVDASGNPSASEVWLSDAALDALVLQGLNGSTTYGVKVKARNGDGDETVLSAEGQGTTLDDTHFSISHDGSADVSIVENISIANHSGGHTVDTSYTGTITLSTSTLNGDWSLVSGSGTLNNSGGGSATYTYVGADNGSVVLGLVNTVAEILNINLTDGTYSEDASEDADLSFAGLHWGRDAQNTTLYTTSNSRSLGGTSPNTDDMQITEIGVYLGAQTGSIRLGVYTGGSLDDPTSATLLWDAGTVTGTGTAGWFTISTGGESWPKNTPTWLAWKHNTGVGIYYSTGSSDAGDFQTVRGRNANSFSQDPTVAFSATYGETGSFSSYWYSIYVGYQVVSASIDHLSISHDGSGINCQEENVTISAHDPGHSIYTSYGGTITLSTSTSHGDWSIITGAGTLNNATADDGAATYAYDAADNGTVVLGFSNTYAETVDIDVTDGSAVEDGTEDANLVFASSGFVFLADSTKNAIGTQIGGKASNVAPGAQTFELEAVKTSDDTGACEAALTGVNSVDLGFECEDPNSCTARQVSISGTDIAGNPAGSVSSYTSVSLDFGDDTDTTATFTLSYPDVGQLQLHARRTLAPSAETMLGTSNSFVVRPFALQVSAAGNPAATSSSGSAFTNAGVDFATTVSAVLWSSADDGDNNGIADNHSDTDPSNNANLSDNTVALNYGQEIVVESVSLTALLDQPSGETDPGLAGGTTIASFTSGSGSSGTTRYDEVGIIEMSALIADGNYLGIGTTATADIIGKSGYVGRFNPARYAVTTSGVTAACSGIFTYARQPFDGTMTLQAQNGSAGGYTRTANYQGGFVTLAPASELVLVNDQTSSAYDLQTIAFTQDFDTGTTGEAVLALQFRWDMAQQAPVISTAQVTGVTDEVSVIAGAPVDIGFSTMRYGRIALTSALGSELVNLAVPMWAEYYVDATTEFVTNSSDSCSSAVTVSFSSYAGNLSVGDTCVLDTGSPGDSGAGCATPGPGPQRFDAPPVGGDFNLFLQAPGAGNEGSVTVDVDVPDWLKFDWDAGVPGDENPSARATFGIYDGGEKQIYQRELY